MKKSIAMKWVNALRSGKYKQGNCRLKDRQGRYCCLGVLCEINDIKFRIDVSEFLNDKAMKVTGMKTPNGNLGEIDLTRLNDSGVAGDPLTFDEIADIIQICYKEL